jgi:diguanylate cyclase (GGDEF)-like protein
MFAVSDPYHVATNQLAQMHRYAGIGFLANIANSLMLIAFLWDQTDHSQLLIWFAAICVASVARLLYARGHQRAEREILSTGQLSGRLLLLTAMNGFAWGAVGLLLYPVVGEPYQLFVIFMLSIACSGALPFYMAAPWMYLIYLLCVLAPLVLTLQVSGQPLEQLMALMLVIFAGTLALTARTMHHGLMDSLHKQSGFQTLASVDALTQLANRRTFDEVLAAEWNRAARARLPLSVILLDIDNFKKYNDLYGHQDGDSCLREVAAALARNIRRSGDLVARYGGDEFVVVLYQMARNEAAEFAEQMRQSVASLRLPHAHNGAGYVTISLGGATCVPNSRENPLELVRAADDALYAAKDAGRDQVQWKSMI